MSVCALWNRDDEGKKPMTWFMDFSLSLSFSLVYVNFIFLVLNILNLEKSKREREKTTNIYQSKRKKIYLFRLSFFLLVIDFCSMCVCMHLWKKVCLVILIISFFFVCNLIKLFPETKNKKHRCLPEIFFCFHLVPLSITTRTTTTNLNDHNVPIFIFIFLEKNSHLVIQCIYVYVIVN